MQFEGATELELKLSSVIQRTERELPASTLATDIVVVLSDAANELQRLRGHWPPSPSKRRSSAQSAGERSAS